MATETETQRHSLAECERELKASPRYDMFRCSPRWFGCSCGREFEHVCDEAEGCSWVVVDGPAMADISVEREQQIADGEALDGD